MAVRLLSMLRLSEELALPRRSLSVHERAVTDDGFSQKLAEYEQAEQQRIQGILDTKHDPLDCNRLKSLSTRDKIEHINKWRQELLAAMNIEDDDDWDFCELKVVSERD